MTEFMQVRTYDQREELVTYFHWTRWQWRQYRRIRHRPTVQRVCWEEPQLEPESIPTYGLGQGARSRRIRQHNTQRVIAALREHGPQTQADLARLCGLNSGTLSRICREAPEIVQLGRRGRAMIVRLAEV